MAELLVAPSAVLAAVTVLRSGLADIDAQPVYTRVPAARPARFVTVSRAGGGSSRFDDAALLIVQAWDDDKAQGEFRSERTARVCAGLLSAAAGTTVGDARVWDWSGATSPAWLPDPGVGIPRFQFTGTLTVKATEHN